MLIANLVLMSAAYCPSHEYVIEKGLDWPSFDLQPVSVNFLVVHGLQKYTACRFTGESSVIKYHQLLSKAKYINGKPRFDQLAKASSSSS